MSREIITAVDLSRIYLMGESEVVGIDRVNLTINQGDRVLLKGESGSGKSTLLSLIAGLDRPTSGKLEVSGHEIGKFRVFQLTSFRREVVGMVFQTFNLLPTLNVLENVSLPGLLAKKDAGKVKKRAQGLLDQVGMSRRQQHYPGQLSGGEMQRTAIARALINDPAIILADEPTGNLDSKNSLKVAELLQQVCEKDRRTLIVATHGTVADRIANRRIGLKDGRIELDS